jgi:hypothetical protein
VTRAARRRSVRNAASAGRASAVGGFGGATVGYDGRGGDLDANIPDVRPGERGGLQRAEIGAAPASLRLSCSCCLLSAEALLDSLLCLSLDPPEL